jgi:hypothetical protein
MEADYDLYEVVYVIDGARLIDPESYERRYATGDASGLASGYYAVAWPDDSRQRRFDERACYYGPFKYKQEAKNAIGWLKRAKEYFAEMPQARKNAEITYRDAA